MGRATTEEAREGQAGGRFPATRRSAVLGLAGDDPAERARAFEVLVRAYHRPVYTHLRLRFGRSPADAEDLTQGFFARAFEKQYLARYDPAKARFRTFLKTCLEGYVFETNRGERRLKRGGGAVVVGLDFEAVERAMEHDAARAYGEDGFDVAWTRGLLDDAVAELERRCRAQGKLVHLEIFRRYALVEDEDRPTYAAVARALGVPVTDVTNHLAWARRAFRAVVLDQLRAITSSDEEFRSEARALLGFAP